MKYVIAAIAIACSASSALAEIPVSNPRVNGRPLDWCLVPTKECGKPAADRYCEMRNMGHAVSFRGQRSDERTYILGTKEICDLSKFDHCDRFSVVVGTSMKHDDSQ